MISIERLKDRSPLFGDHQVGSVAECPPREELSRE